MIKKIVFCGASGAGYEFEQSDARSSWASKSGVAVFAAPDAYGWRVIRIVELTGRDHDVRPIWALHDAERYGASCVFVSGCFDKSVRHAIMNDLEVGLSPVLAAHDVGLAMAA